MTRPLPQTPTVEALKKEAKALLKEHRANTHSCCETLRCHPLFAGMTDATLLAADLSLQQVQHAVAVSYEFENWRALTRHVEEASVFARQVEDMAGAFLTKGPDHNSTNSEWEQKRRRKHAEIMQSEDAFRIAVAFSHSPKMRLRGQAVLFFGLMSDERAIPEIIRLMADRAKRVRLGALRWYARRIHPGGEQAPVSWALATPADRVPDGIDPILPFVADADPKFRKEAICILGAYLGLGDDRIEQAVRDGLDDPVHGPAHAAARLLGVECRNCGVVPDLSQYLKA